MAIALWAIVALVIFATEFFGSLWFVLFLIIPIVGALMGLCKKNYLED